MNRFRIEKRKRYQCSISHRIEMKLLRNEHFAVNSTVLYRLLTALYAPPQRKLQPPLKSRRFSTSLHWSDQRWRSRINHRLRLTRISLGSQRTTLHLVHYRQLNLIVKNASAISQQHADFPCAINPASVTRESFWFPTNAKNFFVLTPILLSNYYYWYYNIKIHNRVLLYIIL